MKISENTVLSDRMRGIARRIEDADGEPVTVAALKKEFGQVTPYLVRLVRWGAIERVGRGRYVAKAASK